MKGYTDIEQSKKLAEILPLESADMTLPFRHTKDDKYLPGCVVARNYIDVYNEMIALPGMDKKEVCKLIQPCWSLSVLLELIPNWTMDKTDKINLTCNPYDRCEACYENPIDAAFEMVCWLKENNKI